MRIKDVLPACLQLLLFLLLLKYFPHHWTLSRVPSLVIRVRIPPLVPAHHLIKELLDLSTPILNVSLRLLLLSFPLCSPLS